MSAATSRVLIIANQTLGGAEMLDRVSEFNSSSGASSFYLLVPATPVGDSPWEAGDYRRHAGVEDAKRRLQQGLELISELGADVSGEVGDADPIDAVRSLLDRGLEFDRILLSTFSAGLSRWVRLDVPHRLARIIDLPTEHIESDATLGAST